MPAGGPDNGTFDKPGRYPAGTVSSVSYYSPSQGTNDTMYVYLPPGYTTSRKYPVVYGHPGISAGADTIFATWCVGAGVVADNLIGEGKIQPVIIVAIDDNNGDVQSDTLNVIIPYIDSHYSTYADADHRGLYGYSWGGGYTFNIGCGNLNTFRYLSPSSAAPNKAGDSSLFPNGGAEAKRVMKTLLISCGNADYLGLYGSSEGAHNYCVANGIPHAWWPVNGGNHDAGVWRPAMWNFLQLADAAGISDPPRTRSAYSQIEAEDSDTHSGGSSETCSEGGLDVGSIVNGNYAVYRNVDFSGGATNFQARVASATSGGNIEVHLDSTNGTLVGTCAVSGTGGWQTWVTQSCPVSGVTGIHNLYLVFTGGSGYLFNVNWWRFGGPSSPVLIPSVPGGLVATAGIERAALRWTASSAATSYNVKRSTTSGGTYTNIANVAGTNYTDRAAIGGSTYYYVVSALNVGGESADSGEASVTPTVNVLSPWLTRDIGVVGLAGSASFTNGGFSLVGSGADIGSAADAFRFAYVTNSGDCTIIARVASLESHINPWSKAGVMIRESLATNAANVFVGVTPGNGVTWQYRSTTGGGTSTNNTTGLGAPYWVKLVRSGNSFTAYRSADGVSWTVQGTTTIAMAATVYVGLAINSHNLYTLCAATFDHVTGPGWAPPPVLAPTSLVATAGVERVTLNWTAAANATSYNVKRATTSGGPYTTIATVTTTNYTDTFVIGRTTYYYVVSALSNLAGESGNSAAASATPTVNVPLPWLPRDIGAVGLSGGAGYTNGVFTVTASGDDIWNSADAFRFVYVTNSGNVTIVARVLSVQNTDGWAKAGVMIRGSLDANAVNAFVAVTPGNGVTFQYRSNTGGGCNNNTAGGSAPYWVKLVRSGNTFTGYCSPNGTNWTQVGSTTLTNVSTAYIGLAVTAHNNSSLCAATFDNVSAPGWPPPPLMMSAIALSSTQVGLTWNSLTNATSYNVKRSATSGGPYTNIATGVTATNYTDTVPSVRLGYYYVVSAMIGGSETTNSPEAAVCFLKLIGGIIGTPGSWGGSGNTITNVFDNDLNTYFDAPDPGNGDWAGLDFGVGVSNVITQINYCPRSGSESRMVGGIFQGANQTNFSDAIALFTVATQPSFGAFTSVNVTNATAFRYVRYLAPDGGYGNVAELEFYGCSFANPVPAPAGLSALAVSTSQINLTWNALTNATSYNLKRSTTNGGPYSTIASGVTATNYPDSGLAGGTTYYYVVSAMVSSNETPNSAQATATTPVPLLLLGRWLSGAADFIETSGYSPAGTFDGFAVASGSYYFTNDVPPNATGVSVRLNNSGIGISNTCLTWDVKYTNTFDNKITNSFTVTCWAKGLPGGWNPWVSKFGENGKGWQLRTDGTSPTYPCWTIRNNSAGTVTLGTAVYGNPEDMASRSIAVNDGKWHHYAGTFDAGLGTRCLYVDGELAAAETGNAVYNTAVTNRLMLGARDGGSSTSSSGGYGSYFTGNLYDVRIYGSAVSQTQVRGIAALTPPSVASQVVGGNQLVLTWSWGTLLQATNLLGPWTAVQASSPYTNSRTASQQFFRISNP